VKAPAQFVEAVFPLVPDLLMDFGNNQRDDLSKRIEALRKDLKLNHRIEERSAVIKDKLQTVYENELKHSLSDRDRTSAERSMER
jgi:hypothetical protein